jgi:long-chain acyl-CoA synthetase
MEGNILTWITERADPSAVALECGCRRITYGQLLKQAAALGEQIKMKCSGARPGKLRIGVRYPSGMNYVSLALAVLHAEACFVPIPDELSEMEQQDLIQRTALDAVINGVATESAEVLQDGEVVAYWLKLRPEQARFSESEFAALNPAFIRFSSGTTGDAKGVILSHESLRARIESANTALRVAHGDRVLWVLPMAHHFAVSIVLYLYFGGTAILAEGAVVGADLLALGRRAGPTVMYGSPVHYRHLVAACAGGKAEWHDLRLAVCTAAALDQATADAFSASFERPLVQAMGIIEAGLPLMNGDGAEAVPTAVGKPLCGWECRLREHTNELLIRGPGMFDAYLDPWMPRDRALETSGWFATGDVARMDDQGRFFLVGRLKSMINMGGMKVFAEEIERVLESHDAVERALVSGRTHSLYGELPMARVMVKQAIAATALMRWCRERLATWKVPVSIEFVSELPITASGKLKRVQ